MSAALTLKINNSNNSIAPICICNWQSIISSVPTKKMKDLNTNLYFSVNERSSVVLLLMHKTWRAELAQVFPSFYSPLYIFFKSKNIVKIKWEHQSLISRYLNFCYPLFTLLEALRSKDRDSLGVSTLSEATTLPQLFFWAFIVLEWNLWSERVSPPKIFRKKGDGRTRFKHRFWHREKRLDLDFSTSQVKKKVSFSEP